MPEATARVVTLCLAALLAWAATAKVVRWSAWRAALRDYQVPGALEAPAAIGIPLAELTVVGLLLSPSPRAGAALTVALLAGFSLAILRGRTLHGEKLPCGCFGRSRHRDYRTMLLRNALLGVLAGLVLLSGREGSVLTGLSLPTAGELVPAILVALGVALAGWTAYQVMGAARRGTRS